MVWSTKSLQFYVEEHFLEIGPEFFDTVVAEWWTSVLYIKSSSASLKCSCFTQSWLLSINLISCEMLLHLFFYTNHCSTLLLPLFQLFCVAAIKVKTRSYFPGSNKMSQLKHLICSLSSIRNKIWVHEICKSLHSVFIYILHSVTIFLHLGLYWTHVEREVQ